MSFNIGLISELLNKVMFIPVFVPEIQHFKQSDHQNVQQVFLLRWKVTVSHKTINTTKNY